MKIRILTIFFLNSQCILHVCQPYHLENTTNITQSSDHGIRKSKWLKRLPSSSKNPSGNTKLFSLRELLELSHGFLKFFSFLERFPN